MRRWLLSAIVVLLLAGFAAPVFAQSSLEFDTVNIAIWPEYDRADVLVIYHLSLSSKMSFPANITIRIPKVVGKPNAVAMQDADGTLVNLNYSSTPDGDWEKLSFSTPTPNIQIEYYDPRLTKNGAERNYEFRWFGDFAVKDVSVQVQEPLGAKQMNITPNFGAASPGQDGLNYYNYDIGALKSGDTFKIALTYQKTDNALSVNSQPVSPSNPITAATPGRLTMKEVLPWMIGGLGLLLILGGAFWFWQSGRDPRQRKGRRRHEPVEHEKEAENQTGPAVYCHQCGRRASAGDVFCRACGTRLRI